MERQEQSVWLTRMRWRLRGAWLWPAFIVLTLAEGVALQVLPIAGDGPGGVLPGVLLAGFANLILIAAVAPLAGHRPAPAPPRPPARRGAELRGHGAAAGVRRGGPRGRR